MTHAARRYRFSRASRLTHDREFQAVYHARCRKSAGPLVVHARPNGTPRSRLGLSVSRHVGTAVHRNRLKRLIREAFRLTQHEWPPGYDFLVVIRPHDTLALEEYRHLMSRAIRSLHHEWSARTPAAPPSPDININNSPS